MSAAVPGIAPAALAIVLARAGSKGLPGKNRRLVAGRPCAAWTLEHALRSRRVGGVVLSTDDEALIDLARSMGVAAVRRSPEAAGDGATVDAAARDALARVESDELVVAPASGAALPRGAGPLVILYANVPVRPADLTDRAVDLLVASGCDSVQSYAPVGKFHPWWMARVDGQGRLGPWQGETLNNGVFRRQDLPACYFPDGGVIALTRAALRLEVAGVVPGPHAFLGVDRRAVRTADGEVIDIDTPADARVAEAVLNEGSGGAGAGERRAE
jgi:CMP-N-acetylneuraminic acid synthetase